MISNVLVMNMGVALLMSENVDRHEPHVLKSSLCSKMVIDFLVA